jgi:hypothetical protein
MKAGRPLSLAWLRWRVRRYSDMLPSGGPSRRAPLLTATIDMPPSGGLSRRAPLRAAIPPWRPAPPLAAKVDYMPAATDSHSDTGCRFVERILTVVQTLRLQKRPALEFLYRSLLAHRKGQKAPQLLGA